MIVELSTTKRRQKFGAIESEALKFGGKLQSEPVRIVGEYDAGIGSLIGRRLRGADLIGRGARLECGDVLYGSGNSHAGDDIQPAVSGNLPSGSAFGRKLGILVTHDGCVEAEIVARPLRAQAQFGPELHEFVALSVGFRSQDVVVIRGGDIQTRVGPERTKR